MAKNKYTMPEFQEGLDASKLKKQFREIFNIARGLEEKHANVAKNKNKLAMEQFYVQIEKVVATYCAFVAHYTVKGVITNKGDDACIGEDFVVTPIQNAGPVSAECFAKIANKSAEQIQDAEEKGVEVKQVNQQTNALEGETMNTNEIKTETVTPAPAPEAATKAEFVWPELPKLAGVADYNKDIIIKEGDAIKAIADGMRFNHAKSKAYEDVVAWNEKAKESDVHNGMLYAAVARYYRLMAEFDKPADLDDNGIMTQHSGMDKVDLMSRLVAADLLSVVGDSDEMKRVADKAVRSIQATPEKEKDGWFTDITIRARGYLSVTWDFVKGVFKYLWNGVWRIAKTVLDVVSYIFGAALSLVDAATTKDFGKSGKPGMIQTGLYAVSERMCA